MAWSISCSLVGKESTHPLHTLSRLWLCDWPHYFTTVGIWTKKQFAYRTDGEEQRGKVVLGYFLILFFGLIFKLAYKVMGFIILYLHR